ncbi:MAG: rhomboid family intramembrane serine protease, partial [Solobacterium sp.]|nr:rhomboid family intramembrane serine protease [Solobacterium sp.]
NMRNYRRFVVDYKTTNILIGICIGVYILQTLNPYITGQFGLYAAPLSQQGFYRIITCAFLHGSLNHLLMNMASLYNIGTYVEERLGDPKYLLVIFVSILTSGTAVVMLSPIGSLTVGFSGVIFGLFGAFIAIMIKSGAIKNQAVMTTILRMLVPNIIISLIPGVSWQGHLGGMLGGLLVGLFVA